MILNAAVLIQHIYFENALTSKFRSKDMLLWRRGFAFVFTGSERLWIHSRSRKIRFDQNALTSKFKSKDMLLWRRGFAFVFIGNERL